MHLTLFFCEDAETTPEGKLNVIGIFDELYAPGFPAQQDQVVLAGIATWDREDSGKKLVQLNVVGPNDKCIFSIEAETKIDKRDADEAPAKSHFVFPLEKLTFNAAGDYYVQVIMGEKTFSAAPLHLIQT